MAAVQLAEVRLVSQLRGVVEFFADAFGDLVCHRSHVDLGEPRHQPFRHPQSGGQQLGVVEVIADGLSHTGVLHLDSDFGAVGQAGGVHLSDGRRRERHRFEAREQLLGWVAQIGLDHGGR